MSSNRRSHLRSKKRKASVFGSSASRALWATPEFWRLVSGCLLFAFALTHFLNHALGIVSLEWMLKVQSWRTFIWRSPPGTVLLASAFLVHIFLALWKAATRRTWRMPPTEVVQILFGLLIPILGAGHVVNTRFMNSLYGFDDNYAVVLNAMRMSSAVGLKQSLFLIIVWVHGVIGINHWIRSKLWYPQWSHIFWIVAVMVPTLALSGWVEGSRQVTYGAAEQQLMAPAVAVAKENVYFMTHVAIWLTFAAFVIMVIVARMIEWFRAGPVITFSPGLKVHAAQGANLLEISRHGGISIAAVCGGRGRCTTCRCLITSGIETLPPPGAVEVAALSRIGSPPGVRLACQITPVAPLTVRPLVPTGRRNRPSSERDSLQWGVEQRITVMFVDIRGFTALAERLYPFDSVFLLNRFFELMSAEVVRHQGAVDKYLGDGFMALFGRHAGAGNSSRNAILAARAMIKALDNANGNITEAIGEPLRMGIGIHTGRAVLGRIGDQASGAITALGDCVNVAARLESLNKEFDSDLIVSDAALSASGLSTAGWEPHDMELRGRDGTIAIHVARG